MAVQTDEQQRAVLLGGFPQQEIPTLLPGLILCNSYSTL